MGTPAFAAPSLKALVEHGHNVECVVTQPDRPKGRGRKFIPSPVKHAANEFGVEVLQPEEASDHEFCQLITDRAPDILIVVAFGQVLKKCLLEIPWWGALNIHASLLPKYRGAAPIHWAILNNETVTGLTAMRMDEGLDTGPILLQEEVSILPDETAGQLHDRLALLSGGFLIKTLEGIVENRLNGRPQDSQMATYAPKINRRMALVKWDQPVPVVSAIIKALDPWPGAFTTLGGKEIKLFSPHVVSEDRPDGVPGRVTGQSSGGIYIETGRGVIEVRELQLSGKKRLPAGDFLRGFPLDDGTILGK